MSKYYVDQDECIGCGLCADIAPDVFEMHEDKAIAIKDNGDNAEKALMECPVGAIKKV
ncbi:MAG: ferredoxin [Christensenellales bacterium]|jgi:ferredoxin